MSSSLTKRTPKAGGPCFEVLEDRLLLTTLQVTSPVVPAFFIYRDRQETNVRVTLYGEVGDAVELLAIKPDPFFREVCDLVGIFNGDPGSVVSWPGGLPSGVVDASGETPVWTTRDWDNNVLGAETEIFAIYVAQCSPSTILTITALTSSELVSDEDPSYTDIETWAGELPWLFATGPDDQVTSPADSGEVLVGADPATTVDGETTYWAGLSAETDVEAIGLYPGSDVAGPLNPGITIAETNEDMGRIFIAGTLSGALNFGTVSAAGTTGGNIEVVYLGFLWGSMTVGGNVNAIVLREGGGGVLYEVDGQERLRTPEDFGAPWPTITAGKSLLFLDSRGGEDAVLYSAVYVNNDPARDYGTTDLTELEYGIYAEDGALDEEDTDPWWIRGDFVDYENNTMDTAQLLGHPSGHFTLSGDVGSETISPNPLVATRQDWYALPLMAGQTIVLDGWLSWQGSMGVRLYDSSAQWMDSFGYETIEDEGIDSRGTTLKPMVFTAPAGGMYYLSVCLRQDLYTSSAPYSLFIENASTAALGGINVISDYADPRRGAAGAWTIRTSNAGGIGGVAVWGDTDYVHVLSDDGGDLVAFQAATVGKTDEDGRRGGYNYLYAGGSIGGVSAIGLAAGTGYIYADIRAGVSAGVPDARICNVSTLVWDFGYGKVWSTGSIGIIDIGRTLSRVDIRANTDNFGPAGRIDLIRVGLDYGGVESDGLVYGPPTIRTGPGGDVGYIYVGGTIYTRLGNFVGPLNPVVVTNGQGRTLSDDNGGTLTIVPHAIVDPLTGEPIIDFFTGQRIYSPYYYYVINTADSGGGGTGVLARLVVEGSVTTSSNTAGKVFQISDLVVLPDPYFGTAPRVTLGGAGTTNVYHLQSSPLESLTVYGNLISADVSGDIVSVTIKSVGGQGGSLGELDVGSTNGWLYGPTAAPLSTPEAEPEYGWYHGSMNGLNVGGSLAQLRVDGALGDLRVEGVLGTVIVNADGLTRAGEWDGVQGVVWAATEITDIRVGDGLADDGGGPLAKAAILSSGRVAKVSITGPRYEVAPDPWDANKALRGNQVFGELNGSIIGISDSYTVVFTRDGRPILVELPAVGRVEGTGGAVLTALVLASTLDLFQCFRDVVYAAGIGVPYTGSVGTVSFSGRGAAIRGMEIVGQTIGSILTSADSDGISNCHFSASFYYNGFDHRYAITEIVGGGGGIANIIVDANGADLGQVRTITSTGDIVSSQFSSTVGMASVSTRNLTSCEFHMPATLGSVTLTGNLRDTAIGTVDNPIGALNVMNVTGSILASQINTARYLGRVRVGGTIDGGSLINIPGANIGYLESLTVVGDIAGSITSSGRIGSIITTAGAITGRISTVADGWSVGTRKWDIALIQTARGYSGELSVAGSLKRFTSAVSLGDNPEDTSSGRSQVFDIRENLDYLRVGNGTAPAHLYAEVYVGDNIGTMDIDGTLYGRVTTNGDLKLLTLDGGLGGQLDVDQDGILENVGSLAVYGTIGSMRFNPNAHLYADLTVGGSLSRLDVRQASIYGDITSRYGSIGSIRVTGGSILGAITAQSIGTVSVTGGNIAGAGLSAAAGGIKSVTITGGTLNADLTTAGVINLLNIVGSATGGTISAEGGLNRVNISGDLDADILSGRGISSLTVKGALTGSVDAATSIGTMTITGDVSGTVRAGAGIGSLTAGSLTGATISSASHLGQVKISGNADDSFVLAGYDTGADGQVDAGDDNPITAAVHSGNIKSVAVGGALSRTVVAAGVGPGDLSSGAYAGFLNTADNTFAPGVSSILKMTVSGGFGPGPDLSVVLADTSIDPAFLAAAGAAIVAQAGVTGPISGSGIDFGPAVGSTTLTVGDLTLTLTGEGVANYDPVTGALVLERTGSRSALRIASSGAPATIQITGSDDSGLSTLLVTGPVTLGNVSIDGPVGMLRTGPITPGAIWNLPGGVRSAFVTAMNGVTISAGEVGTWSAMGSLSGTFRADSIKRLFVTGSVAGNITSVLGDAETVTLNGSFSGQADIRGTVRTLSVTGAMDADVDVSHGDLLTLRAAGLSGVVGVERGKTNSVTITSGDFTGSYRTAGGVGSFMVSKGQFRGLLSTEYDLGRLHVSGNFGGRVRSAGAIKSASLGSMTSGLIAAAGNLDIVTLRGTMDGSWIFSGFDPGDAGYVPGETGNVAIGGSGAQADTPAGGSIRLVQIAGAMNGSTISAAVGPGQDGSCGTHDDVIRGSGTVGRVIVTGLITGSGAVGACGVFAASNLPTVYRLGRQPFSGASNVIVGSQAEGAGPLSITNVQLTYNAVVLTFSRSVDCSTVVLGSTLSLLMSADSVFDPATDTNLTSYLRTPVWDPSYLTLTATLSTRTWQQFVSTGTGRYLQITVDGTPQAVDGDRAIMDRRGNVLDGEFIGGFPTGDGLEGGNLVYEMLLGDRPGTFGEAITTGLLAIPVDGGTRTWGERVDSGDDVDIFGFSGAIYDYISLGYFGSWGDQAEMCLFYRDTQGTLITTDDTFEAVARYEISPSSGTLTLAYELPATGEYYLAVGWDSVVSTTYQVSFTMASTDTHLVQDVGGNLLVQTQIGYVSNTVGQHRNALGANRPKQLVYLNFNGGTATQGNFAAGVSVSGFTLSEIDTALAGRESEIINGSGIVTGIVDNIMSIYTDTPATLPAGSLVVQRIDPGNSADWAAYQSASSGLWFTTVDPAAARGLDPETDFTTIFIGRVAGLFTDPSYLGLASDIDLMNQSKADNAVVFSNHFGGRAVAGTADERMNKYSLALANTTAHELGHVLGLNHQPTNGYDYLLIPDDPDNNPATPDDSNQGVGLMAYAPWFEYTSRLWQLGTQILSRGEFPVGHIDTADLLLRWLA